MTKQLLELGDNKSQLLGSGGLNIKIRGIISTQAASLDDAIGRGGIPLGRLSILHGGEGSGKTTIALHIAAECQRLGGKVIYIDNEYKLDPEYAAKVGVNLDQMIYHQPDHLEEAFDYMDKVIELVAAKEGGSKKPYLIVLDSMNASISKAEFEGEWEDQHMAPQARVFSRLLPKLIPKASKANVALLWISQVRTKMNVQYGDADEIAGGKAARFYASLIMHVKGIGKAKAGEEAIGTKVIVQCKKNQIAMPFKTAELEISWGKGVNKEASLLDLADKYKVVTKPNYSIISTGEVLGNGLPRACKALRASPALRASLIAAIEKRDEAKKAEAEIDDAPEPATAKPKTKTKAKVADAEE